MTAEGSKVDVRIMGTIPLEMWTDKVAIVLHAVRRITAMMLAVQVGEA